MVHIRITYEGKNHDVELSEGSTVEDAIKHIDINPETVLARRGKEIVPDSEKVKERDRIELMRIVSGG